MLSLIASGYEDCYLGLRYPEDRYDLVLPQIIQEDRKNDLERFLNSRCCIGDELRTAWDLILEFQADQCARYFITTHIKVICKFLEESIREKQTFVQQTLQIFLDNPPAYAQLLSYLNTTRLTKDTEYYYYPHIKYYYPTFCTIIQSPLAKQFTIPRFILYETWRWSTKYHNYPMANMCFQYLEKTHGLTWGMLIDCEKESQNILMDQIFWSRLTNNLPLLPLNDTYYQAIIRCSAEHAPQTLQILLAQKHNISTRVLYNALLKARVQKSWTCFKLLFRYPALNKYWILEATEYDQGIAQEVGNDAFIPPAVTHIFMVVDYCLALRGTKNHMLLPSLVICEFLLPCLIDNLELNADVWRIVRNINEGYRTN